MREFENNDMVETLDELEQLDRKSVMDYNQR